MDAGPVQIQALCRPERAPSGPPGPFPRLLRGLITPAPRPALPLLRPLLRPLLQRPPGTPGLLDQALFRGAVNGPKPVSPFGPQVVRERVNLALAPVSTAEAFPEEVSTPAHPACAGAITPSSPRLTGPSRPFFAVTARCARGRPAVVPFSAFPGVRTRRSKGIASNSRPARRSVRRCVRRSSRGAPASGPRVRPGRFLSRAFPLRLPRMTSAGSPNTVIGRCIRDLGRCSRRPWRSRPWHASPSSQAGSPRSPLSSH